MWDVPTNDVLTTADDSSAFEYLQNASDNAQNTQNDAGCFELNATTTFRYGWKFHFFSGFYFYSRQNWWNRIRNSENKSKNTTKQKNHFLIKQIFSLSQISVKNKKKNFSVEIEIKFWPTILEKLFYDWYNFTCAWS